MKYKLKSGVVYQGVMYRAGEIIDIGDDDLQYAFNWLRQYIVQTPDVPPAQDDLVVNALPPLDEPKRRRKNDA